MQLFHRTDEAIDTLADEIATIHRIMAQSPARKRPVFAAPSHCPTCGEWGLVDNVTLTATSTHCYLCGTEWVVTRRALNAVEAEPTPLYPVPPTDGVLFTHRNHPSNPGFAPRMTS